MMSQDEELRTFFGFILKYFLPMPVVENENVKNRVRMSLIKAMVDAEFENLFVPPPQNQYQVSSVSSGSRLDGLSVPDHIFVSTAGSADFSRGSYEVSDMDEMTVLANLFVSKDGVSKSRIFDTEPTSNPLYIRLRLTKEYVKLRKREGCTLSRTDNLRTRAATGFAMNTLEAASAVKSTSPESHNGVMQVTDIHGPAASAVTDISDIDIKAEIGFDSVVAIHHNLWPAEDWEHRHRKSGWPDKSLVRQCVSAGCYIVPVGPGGLQGLEWRYSFTAQERCLANSLTLLQKKVYIIIKLIQRHCVLAEFPSTALSSYHLKNVFFWLCEKIPRSHWTEANIYHLLITFLDEMLGCLVRGCLPHYFVPEGNLFARVPKAHLRQLARSIKKSRINMFEVLGTLGRKVSFIDYDARNPMYLFIQSQHSQPTASLQQILVSTLSTLTDDFTGLIRLCLGKIKEGQANQPDGLKSKDNEEKDRNTLSVLSTPTSEEDDIQRPKDGASETAGEWIHYQGLYHIALNILTECLQMAVCDMENLRMNTSCQHQHTREFMLAVMMKYMAKHFLEPDIVLWILTYINFKTEKHMDVRSTLENSLALYEKNDPTALTREEYNTWKLSVLTAAGQPVVSECLPNAEWHERIIMAITYPNSKKDMLKMDRAIDIELRKNIDG